ncbi:MAG TPA: molybdenum cofactor biosynthesis protein MoaE [Pyrinomonadaceae bacterium]|jgi:molybdopterin synthase catalytic subunit|nr:molybdenum cofactor biosynthesis protein MoaE [Pyrinomonadaceae bacterium]
MTTIPPPQVSIRVLFFGAARDVVNANQLDLSLDAPATVSSAFQNLIARFAPLERFGRSLLFAVNQEYATPDTLLKENDELAVFPPVSGGSCDYRCPNDFFELTTEPIDVGQVARRVVLPECGATVTLDGYAREWTKGKRTLYLVYEAYDSMALSEMERLGAEAHKQFEIAHLGIVHRTGRLEIGETSVVIAASAPHRKAAFEACEWAIKELKRTVPIWKKEVYENGEEWVDPRQSAD